MEDQTQQPQHSTNGQPAELDEAAIKALKTAEANQRKTVIMIVIGGIVLIALLVLVVIALLQPSTPTDKIRDIFIIFMAVESLFIGFTLVILIVQISRLINLLNNEIRPILDSTNESVNTLRGTVRFLSDNLSEPVIKLNEYLASFKQFGDFFRFMRKDKTK